MLPANAVRDLTCVLNISVARCQPMKSRELLTEGIVYFPQRSASDGAGDIRTGF